MIALFGSLVWLGHGGRAPIIVSSANAVPVEGHPGVLRLFLSIENAGRADGIVAVRSDEAEDGLIYAPDGVDSIPLPAGGKAILAADGAHLILQGIGGDINEGRLIPLTLEFASGHSENLRARITAPILQGDAEEAGVFGLGTLCRTGEGEPAPAIVADVEPDGEGWRLRMVTEDFTFTEPIDGLGHVPGYGHAHLYVDGVKLQRLYAPEARIGALLPGEHVISVTLYTNDHRAYVTNDVVAEVRVTVVQD